MTSTRLEATARRWGDVAAHGFIAALVWSAIDFELVFVRPAPALFALSGTMLAALAAGVLLVGYWRYGRGRLAGFLGTKRLFRYPPTWVAVVVGFALLTLTRSDFRELAIGVLDGLVDGAVAAWPLGLVWLFFLALLTGNARTGSERLTGTSTRSIRSAASSSRGLARLTPDELLRWAGDDHEVQTSAQDLFEHTLVAQRIVARIQSQAERELSVALVGRVGSGKSSICAIVEEAFEHNASIRCGRISLWKYSTPNAAVEGVLRCLLELVGRDMPLLPIGHLATEYIQLVEGGIGKAGWLTSVLGGEKTPERVLERISEMLVAADIRCVLVIEDFERYLGLVDPVLNQTASRRRVNSELAEPVRSLLHLLDQSPRISILMASTTVAMSSDVEKIVRFVEYVPDLDPGAVWDVLSKVRNHLLKANRSIIDPCDPKVRAIFDWPADAFSQQSLLWSHDRDNPSLHRSVAMLCATPRVLKLVLRECEYVWSQSAGELDIDSMLVASMLKAARPQVFSVLDRHSSELQLGFHTVLNQPFDDWVPKLEFNRALATEVSVRERAAIRRLAVFLFPALEIEDYQAESQPSERPQQVSALGGDRANYWRRFASPASIPLETSDQLFLGALRDWRSERSEQVVDLISDPRFAGALRQFANALDPSDLVALVQVIAVRNQNWLPSRIDPGEHIVPLVSVWNAMLVRRPDGSALADALVESFVRLTPVNLALVCELRDWFASSAPPLLSRSETRRVLDSLTQCVHQLVVAPSIDSFATAARSAGPRRLFQLILGVRADGWAESRGHPMLDWPELWPVLIRWAETNRAAGLPLLALLLTVREESVAPGSDQRLNRVARFRVWPETDMERYFDLDALARASGGALPSDLPDDREVRERVAALQEWARARGASSSGALDLPA